MLSATEQHALAAEPQRLGLLPLLRRLQHAAPELPRLGTSSRLADDPVRLGQPPSMAFAPGLVAAFTPAEDGHAPQLDVHGLGLFGPNGPLPGHLTELAFERRHHHGDGALAAFVDVFHHRMLSLLFRAWAECDPAVDRDRPDESQAEVLLAALIGLPAAPAAPAADDPMPQPAKLHHAGRVAGQARNAEGLAAMLAEQLGVPVVVEPFTGGWLDLPVHAQLRLGHAGALGGDAVIGTRCWSASHRFTVRIGPLAWDDYCRFLPGAPALALLRAVVRHGVGEEFEVAVEPVLARDAVPCAQLTHRAATGAALGHGLWLGRPAADAQALCLSEPVVP